MLTPARALARSSAVDPLPEVFPALTARGFRFMRAEVTLLAGMPNAGKSFIALWMAKVWAEAGERVLYCSADSNEMTQLPRLAAMLTGHTTRTVREGIEGGGAAFYEDALSDVDIRFDFNSNPTLDDIELTMAAYEETYGEYPSVVIIDNLINVEGVGAEGDNHKQGLMEIQKVFKYLCRTTEAAFIVAHHCKESDGKPGWPPRRKAIQLMVNELPEAEVTVAYDPDTKQFGFGLVKCRHIQADPEATDPVWVYADLDRAAFYNDRYAATIAGVRA